MRFNLKDLDIKKISLVSKKARPANNKAKIAFIKSEELNKEEKEMKLTDLIKSYIGKKEEISAEEAQVSKETENAEETQEFITKTEFSARMESLESLIKEAAIQKSEETNKLTSFLEAFAKSYQDDITEVKSSVIKTITDARKKEVAEANKAMGEQESMEALVAKSGFDPISYFMTPEGTNTKSIVEKGIQDGTLKVKTQPKIENSFKTALRASVGLS